MKLQFTTWPVCVGRAILLPPGILEDVLVTVCQTPLLWGPLWSKAPRHQASLPMPGVAFLSPLWLPRSRGRACYLEDTWKKSYQPAPWHFIWTLWPPVPLLGISLHDPCFSLWLWLTQFFLGLPPPAKSASKDSSKTLVQLIAQWTKISFQTPTPKPGHTRVSSQVWVAGWDCKGATNHSLVPGEWWQRSWCGLPSSFLSLLCRPNPSRCPNRQVRCQYYFTLLYTFWSNYLCFRLYWYFVNKGGLTKSLNCFPLGIISHDSADTGLPT